MTLKEAQKDPSKVELVTCFDYDTGLRPYEFYFLINAAKVIKSPRYYFRSIKKIKNYLFIKKCTQTFNTGSNVEGSLSP